jgi:hypothetical protein
MTQMAQMKSKAQYASRFDRVDAHCGWIANLWH